MGSVNKQTDTYLRGIKPGNPQKIGFGGRLYLDVSATGSPTTGGMSWRLNYTSPISGKQQTLTFGRYPAVGITEARRLRDEAKALLAKGIDPGEQKKADKAAKISASQTFEKAGEEWFEKTAAGTVPTTQKKTRMLLNFAIARVGKETFSGMERKTLVDAVKDIQENIGIHAAHRVAGVINRVCLYAWDCGYTDRNIADRIGMALKPHKTRHRAAVIDPKKVSGLLQRIDYYQGEGFSIAYCLKILPYLALRSVEIREARWTEIDLTSATWTVPAMRDENGGGMKMRIEHRIPLSRQVVTLFEELRRLQEMTMPGCEMCFPSPRNRGKAVTGEALLCALKNIYGGKDITVHGFRTTFSTMARELGLNPAHIEKQLAHREKDGVIEAYDRSQYFEQRREMMQRWADYLDMLKANSIKPILSYNP